MFVKYNGKYYCSRTADKIQQIWRYNTKFRFSFLDGLCKEQHTVNQDDIEEIFSATFCVIWNEQSCVVEAIKGHRLMKLSLWSNKEDFAKEHGFKLSKKDGKYYKIVPMQSATRFYIIKKLFIPKKKLDKNGFYDTEIQQITLSQNEWVDLFLDLSNLS